MFLSTPLSLTFFFFYTSSINSVYAHNSGSAAASSADLFAVAYPIVAYPFASVSWLPFPSKTELEMSFN